MKRFALLALLATPAHAQWSTATHFGYALHQDAATEFENAGGTVLFLDVGRTLWKNVDIGLRTAAQGAAQGGREYYRLGAGPMVSVAIGDSWAIHAAALRYRESGIEEGEDLYRSSGTSLQLGWQRRLKLAENADFAWGGYVAQAKGVLSPAAGSQALVGSHTGMDRGLTMALRLRL